MNEVNRIGRSVRLITFTLYLFLLILGVLGCSATLVLLKFERGLRTFTKTMFYFQAIVDMMQVTLAASSLVYQQFQALKQKPFSQEFIMFLNYMMYIIENSSIYCLGVVAFERMCMVVWPTNPIIRRASLKEAMITSLSLIIINLGLSVIRFVGLGNNKLSQIILVTICSTTTPLVIILTLSAVFLYKVKTNISRINPTPQNTSNQPSLLAIKMVAVGSIFIFITAIPLMGMNIKINLLPIESPYKYFIDQTIRTVFVLFWTSTFALKFYLYTIFIPHFRKEFFNLCRKAKNKVFRN